VPTRRRFLHTGLQAALIGLAGRRLLAAPPAQRSGGPWAARPFTAVRRAGGSIRVGGLPFAPGFTGDTWDYADMPFHTGENQYPGGVPPVPTEEVEVAVVGGGLSGLATAYLLRHRHPVLLELRPTFGGVCGGETWAGIHYSLGGAYFIAPDPGSELEALYHELGLDDVFRLSPGGQDTVELEGVLRDDFWTGAGMGGDDAAAFRSYAEIVRYYADESYPEIPLDDTQDNDWILALDRKTLREDVEERLGRPAPPLLAAGIQAYCYSSFGAGWETISAAAGWNFVAAEEYGRWVCPGGNAWVADVLWRKLLQGGGAARRLRPGCRAVEVRLAADGRVRVIYKDAAGAFGALLARRVVLACPKHVAKYLLPDVPRLDPEKDLALHAVMGAAYLVANVLVDAPVRGGFYDAFLLGHGDFPMDEGALIERSRVVDVVNGDFTRRPSARQGVLTLYWPLPWASARFTLLERDSAWQDYASRLAPQIDAVLGLLGLHRRDVRQVRMSRWGHALPVAYPGFIASGFAHHARRPFAGCVYFVNQDNWALPAFETCLLEALCWTAEIDATL
jgi:hypothetical protein